MRILALLLYGSVLLLGCRREHVKVQHTAVEIVRDESVQSDVSVDTRLQTSEDPSKVTEESEVLVFGPPPAGSPDAGPILREIKRAKKVTETGAKKEDLSVGWHGISDTTMKGELRMREDAMEHTVSEPDLGYGWIYYALILAGVGYLGWRLRKYV